MHDGPTFAHLLAMILIAGAAGFAISDRWFTRVERDRADRNARQIAVLRARLTACEDRRVITPEPAPDRTAHPSTHRRRPTLQVIEGDHGA